MGVERTVTFTCDRCGASHSEDGFALFAPEGWSDVVVKGSKKSYDHDSVEIIGVLCPNCTMDLRSWVINNEGSWVANAEGGLEVDE